MYASTVSKGLGCPFFSAFSLNVLLTPELIFKGLKTPCLIKLSSLFAPLSLKGLFKESSSAPNLKAAV